MDWVLIVLAAWGLPAILTLMFGVVERTVTQSVRERRDSARKILCCWAWPYFAVRGLVRGVRKMWVLADWGSAPDGLASRGRRFFNDVGVAAHNILVLLITPPTWREDEVAAREFAAKMRGLGCDPADALHMAAMFAAAGVSDDDAGVFAKIAASRQLTREDLLMLTRRGYRLGFTPVRLNNNDQAGMSPADNTKE